MRVLTITEALLKVILKEELLVETCSLTHVSCNHHIVLSSVSVCLCRKLETGFLCCVAGLADLSDDLCIVLRVADYSHSTPVLCCRTKHRRTSYVDILDCIFHSHIRLCNCLLERIKVYTDHIDELDAVLLELCNVAVKVTTSKKTSVNLRMKGLYAAITDFRKSSDLADVDYSKSCILQKLHCATGCDNFPTELHKLTCEFYYACLV